MIATLLLCYWVISREAAAQRYSFTYQQRDSLVKSSPGSSNGGGYWTVFFAYYALFIHVLVFIFPLRANWAIWDLTQSLKRIARSRTLRDFKPSQSRRVSSTSLSSSETLTSSYSYSSTSSEAGDGDSEFLKDSGADSDPERVVHAIIIPNYKEEMDTLRETLDVLASHPQARISYDVSCRLFLCVCDDRDCPRGRVRDRP